MQARPDPIVTSYPTAQDAALRCPSAATSVVTSYSACHPERSDRASARHVVTSYLSLSRRRDCDISCHAGRRHLSPHEQDRMTLCSFTVDEIDQTMLPSERSEVFAKRRVLLLQTPVPSTCAASVPTKPVGSVLSEPLRNACRQPLDRTQLRPQRTPRGLVQRQSSRPTCQQDAP
jgi:hypothetical protein